LQGSPAPGHCELWFRHSLEGADPPRTRAAANRFLHQILALYLGDTPVVSRVCRICGSPGHGKPHLSGPNPWVHFNMSHSKRSVVVAVTGDREVGVDLEFDDGRVSLSTLLGALGEGEQGQIGAQAEPIRDAAYRAWVTKEAVLKGLGVGLAHPLELVDTTREEPMRGWHVTSVSTMREGWYASVATAGGPVNLVHRGPDLL
jgi:4'-phosphopantetheinyl transferase